MFAASNSTTTGHTNHFDDTLGAFLLGTFGSLVLYGVILQQTYRYVRLHQQDYTYIQVLVALSLILETLHTMCTMHFSYHALVTNYLDPKALGKTVWSLDFFMIAGGFSQIATYSFFIRRVSFIGKSFKHVALLAAVCLAIDLGFSIAMTVDVVDLKNPENFLSAAAHKLNILVHGKFAAASATHALLTGSLMYALCWGLRAKARKEHKSVVDWCSLYVVNTGLLVSVSDVVSWILAATLPGTVWWAALSMATVKLYMVTFLSVLNSRRLLTETGITIFGPGAGADSGSAMALSLSLPSGRNFILRAQRSATAERYNAPQLPERAPTRIDIKVATEVEEGDGGSPTGSRTSHSSVIGIGEGKAGVRM